MSTYDRLNLFTFTLLDGRKVTYAGVNEKQAFFRAGEYHGRALHMSLGVEARPCRCNERRPRPTREGGWLVCDGCGGYIG